jgi:hypothetical protein
MPALRESAAMKWEDRRPSQNVEDRTAAHRDGEADLLDTAVDYLAQGVNEIAASAGLVTGPEELRDQLFAAQRELDLAMLEMREAGASETDMAALRQQAQTLVQLQRALTDRGRAGLDDLKGPIAAAVTASTALAATGRDTALASKGTDPTSMAAITAATRRQVENLSRDIYERKIFDPYLSFASAEEEAEYRRREQEAKRYMEAEMAKGTPEGDLNAAGAAQGQLLDAAAHGAADSPEFKERWEALEKTAREQREAIRASGGSTEEYDKRIEDSVRRFLRSKGVSEEDIDKAIAATNGDPLQAVKPYLEGEKDAQGLENSVRDATRRSDKGGDLANEDQVQGRAQESAVVAEGDVFAQFRSTGVQYTGDGNGHGLNGGNARDRDGPPLPP